MTGGEMEQKAIVINQAAPRSLWDAVVELVPNFSGPMQLAVLGVMLVIAVLWVWRRGE